MTTFGRKWPAALALAGVGIAMANCSAEPRPPEPRVRILSVERLADPGPLQKSQWKDSDPTAYRIRFVIDEPGSTPAAERGFEVRMFHCPERPRIFTPEVTVESWIADNSSNWDYDLTMRAGQIKIVGPQQYIDSDLYRCGELTVTYGKKRATKSYTAPLYFEGPPADPNAPSSE